MKNKYFDADEDIDDHTREMLNEKLDYITKVVFYHFIFNFSNIRKRSVIILNTKKA